MANRKPPRRAQQAHLLIWVGAFALIAGGCGSEPAPSAMPVTPAGDTAAVTAPSSPLSISDDATAPSHLVDTAAVPAATATDVPSITTDPPSTPLPEAVQCGLQYRPNAESMEGAVESTLRAERRDGSTADGSVVEFDTMRISVVYTGDGPDGASTVHVAVSSGADAIVSVLYQVGIPGLGDIDFAGGHGFTGLHYVHHLEAQLQFWCSAER